MDSTKEKDSITLNLGAVSGTPNVTITSTQHATVSSPYIFTTGSRVASPWAGQSGTGSKINLDGKDADLVINGKSLTDTLQALEERLNILVPNPELEKEWTELKKLGDKYRELEAELKEKADMWGCLKATEPKL